MTVMFCDLVGSTAMAQGLDEEDVREILARYHRLGEERLSGYGGHIAQFLGDGLLVYFGYPEAHEDDAERAVRAGLDFLLDLEGAAQSGGPRLQARIGIHTGPVVVGEVGSLHRHETLAQGGTMNFAARIQSVAEPGTLAISNDTLRLVTGIFLTQDLGPQKLKGIEGRVEVHKVLQPTGVRSRLDIAGARLTPLVGRDLELGLLLDRWEQVCEGEGQVVLVTGEAGVGKSRLALALRQRLEGQPHTWLECRCSPFAQNSPFHPVLELVQQGLLFLPADSEADKLAKLERGVIISGFDPAEWVPLFVAFLGISAGANYTPLELSPEYQRQKTVEGLTRWLLALSALQPLVLMIEDLHWNDPSSLEVLSRVVEQSPTARVLLVGTARPEFAATWRQQSNQTPIQLAHMGRRQSRDLAQRVSPDRKLPDEVLDAIVERSGGVPLFVEELARMVIESGMLEAEDGRYVLKGSLADLAIPHTLHDSLAARLDRLSAAKEVAQIAAALGREFPYALLAAVAGMDEPKLRQGLDRLVQAELLYQRGAPPDAIYIFKHALVQDAAYETMLRKARHALHARIASTLLDRFPKRVQAAPEYLARHLELSGQTLDAIIRFREAAESGAARHANLEAISHAEHALGLIAALPNRDALAELELGLLLVLGNASIRGRGYGHPTTMAAMEAAVKLCDVVANQGLRALALTSLSANRTAAGDAIKGAELARRVIEIGEMLRNDMYLVLGHTQAAYAETIKDNPAASLKHAETAVKLYLYEAHGQIGLTFSIDQGVAAHNFAQTSLLNSGYPDRAKGHRDAMAQLAERINHPTTSVFSAIILAATAGADRDFIGAQRWARTGIEISDRYGFPQWRAICELVYEMSRTRANPGPDTAAATMNSFARMKATGALAAPALHISACEALLAAERTDFAREILRDLPETCERSGRHRILGEILLIEGGEAAAESEFRAAIELAREQGARFFELRAAMDLARLWKRQGKTIQARELLGGIYSWFTEGFDNSYLQEARSLLDELRD